MEDEPSVVNTRGHEARFLIAALIAGVFTGVLGGLFHLAAEALVEWPTQLGRHLEGLPLLAACSIITMAATLFAVWLTRRHAPEASGSGIPEIEAAIEGSREIRWRRGARNGTHRGVCTDPADADHLPGGQPRRPMARRAADL